MKNFFFLMSFLLLGRACTTMPSEDLKNGDLLFVTAQKEDLSGAINRVTQKKHIANYDHVAIIERAEGLVFVWHAAPSGGTQKEKLSDFIKKQTKNNVEIMVYRLKPKYQYAIPRALQRAVLFLGKPYNYTYILNDESLYCSDFIERIFREDHVFKLIPMTFKNPKTGRVDDFWIRYYQSKNREVPEGSLGSNPNNLASSEVLVRLKRLK